MGQVSMGSSFSCNIKTSLYYSIAVSSSDLQICPPQMYLFPKSGVLATEFGQNCTSHISVPQRNKKQNEPKNKIIRSSLLMTSSLLVYPDQRVLVILPTLNLAVISHYCNMDSRQKFCPILRLKADS